MEKQEGYILKMANLMNKLVEPFLSTKGGMLLVGTSKISGENLFTEWEISEGTHLPQNVVSRLQENISRLHSIYFKQVSKRDRLVSVKTTCTYEERYFLGYKFEEIIEQEIVPKYENK